ncbi:HDOD domain-containing protein [Calditrichota bacterium]
MNEKFKILFVDDEQFVLDGLRRNLSHMRSEWQMSFANDGRKALEILGQEQYDVIVSDLRMPGMDGVALLEEVKNNYPEMIRIILSGYSSEEAVLKVVNTAHQFLSKPCQESELVAAVKQAKRVRQLLSDKDLKLLASKLSKIPSVPLLYTKLIKELQSEDSSIRNVGNIIVQDAGMTAKILQLVNSAFFGLPKRITNPVIAVNLLGINTILALVLSVKIFEEFDVSKTEILSIDEVFEHGFTTATYARAIAKAENFKVPDIDDSFVAGILHDCGRLLLIGNIPEVYSEVCRLAELNKLSIEYAEKQEFKVTHAELGAYLLGIWGLPDTIINAVAYHHNPLDSMSNTCDTIMVVYMANKIANALQSNQAENINETLDMNYLERINSADKVQRWVGICSSLDEKGNSSD